MTVALVNRQTDRVGHWRISAQDGSNARLVHIDALGIAVLSEMGNDMKAKFEGNFIDGRWLLKRRLWEGGLR